MVSENVKCGRCDQWFKREILEVEGIFNSRNYVASLQIKDL